MGMYISARRSVGSGALSGDTGEEVKAYVGGAIYGIVVCMDRVIGLD